jgi:hypothetical protein
MSKGSANGEFETEFPIDENGTFHVCFGGVDHQLQIVAADGSRSAVKPGSYVRRAATSGHSSLKKIAGLYGFDWPVSRTNIFRKVAGFAEIDTELGKMVHLHKESIGKFGEKPGVFFVVDENPGQGQMAGILANPLMHTLDAKIVTGGGVTGLGNVGLNAKIPGP